MKIPSLNPFLVKQILATTSFFAMSVGAQAASNTWVGTTNVWDTATTANWTSPTTWTAGDDAIFNSTGAGIVAIAGAGVSAHNLTFNNTGYTIQGGNLTLSGTTPTITVTNLADSATISSIIAGSAGLTKTGAGTLNLTATKNTYTGTTIVNGGTLKISPTQAGANFASTSLINTVNNDGTLHFDLSGITHTDFTNSNLGATTLASGATAVLETSAAHNLYTTVGPTTRNASLLTTGTSFSGTGTIKKEGAGIIDFLDGASLATFDGAIIVNAGTLSFQMGSAGKYSGKATLEVNSGGIADARTNTLIVDSLTGDGMVSTSFSTAAIISVGNNGGGGTFSGKIVNGAEAAQPGTWAGAIGFTKNGGGTQILSNTLSTYTGVTTINGGTLEVARLANGGGSNTSSIGRATNVAANLVINGGTLKFTGTTGNGSTDHLFTIGTNGATIDASSTDNTALTFTNTGSLATTAGATGRTLTLTGTTSAATLNSLASVIVNPTGGGTTAVTKSGGNTWVLSGINTYSGATNVDGGKLTIASTGSINNTSGVTINGGEFNYNASTALTQTASFTGTGGILSGSGTINNSVNVTSGNTLAIGNSAGTMTFGTNLTIGGTYLYEMDGGTLSADLGNVEGLLTLGGTLDLVQLGTYTLGQKFTLFSYNGTLGGAFTGLAEGDTLNDDLGGLWQIAYDDSVGLNGGSESNFITITAIPEPAAALLGSLGLLALLRRRRN